MPFQKGHKLTGSRKGKKNTKTLTWETFVGHCMTGGLDKFQTEMNALKGKDYVHAFLTLLEYHKPKLARTTIQGDPENPLELNTNQIDVTKLSEQTLRELASVIGGTSEAATGADSAT